MDADEGHHGELLSLHKFRYANENLVKLGDPGGLFGDLLLPFLMATSESLGIV